MLVCSHSVSPPDQSAGGSSSLSHHSHHLSNRRQSGAKLHSLSVEAPITKVVNLLLAVQEKSPSYISEALDKVNKI